MKKKLFFILTFLTIFVIYGCSSSNDHEPKEITVSAAASLKNVLEEITTKFQEENPQIDVRFNFGASGTLTQQIKQGAPVDLFISANSEKYKELQEQEFVQEPTILAGNELVVITSKEEMTKIETIKDLTTKKIEKITIGTPSIVPAGTYAKQAFEFYRIWDKIEGKIVYAKDVRQVLTYVESGNVQAGIVYKTDAQASDKVTVIPIENQESYDEITYPAGIIQDSTNKKLAETFLNYIQNEESKQIWTKYGFTMN